MNKDRITDWVVGGACALTLGACHSAPTRIYPLDTAPPQARVDAYHAPPLRIDTLNVPASWDRIEILSLSAPGNFKISDLDHWSAPLAQIARQALSADLDLRLPSGSVVYPRLPKPSVALGVNVDILEFSMATPRASMRASWVITAPAGSQTAQRSVAVLQGRLSSAEPAAVAHAWSELIGQLADRIAMDAALFKTP